MLKVTLFALLLSVSGTLAVPMTLEKRTNPFLGGINLAGCEFGITTSGGSGSSQCPRIDQITHFATQGVNLFRIPVGWQYLVSNNPASTSLDPTFFAVYDNLVRTALSTGAHVLIDLHNYARWNGAIISQGGPSNENFASVWSLIAAKYAAEPNVIFGLMNEPHEVDISIWAATCQAAVTAIRAAGAKTQMIVLPGNGYTNAAAWYQGQDTPMLSITDPASADKSLLILDVHAYLDSDYSGQSPSCVRDGVGNLQALSTFLTTNGRRAILSETGGGDPASCIPDLGAELAYVASNTNFVGFAVWPEASPTYPTYALSIVPTNGVDTRLFTEAIKPHLGGASGDDPAPNIARLVESIAHLTVCPTSAGC